MFLTETEVQLVMELLRGGELFDRMVERGPYSEAEASRHVRKIGEALQYLHSKGIVHRDLKPENLILTDKSADAELKIADFGLSKIVEDIASSTMATACGTWAYAAPEVRGPGAFQPPPPPGAWRHARSATPPRTAPPPCRGAATASRWAGRQRWRRPCC